ncbi:MAG: hypothetical protein J6C82_01185 [Clostridia bacterium]|nr:hypothetical protein [Clostridia bacterium]
MLKKLISSILAVSIALSALIIPQIAEAKIYEYTYTFTKHGYAETIVDGESAYKTAGNANFSVDLSADDSGVKIPAADIKYMKFSYYIELPNGVTSGASGKTFYAQIPSSNAYTVYTSDGTSSKVAGTSGFINFGATSQTNSWAYSSTVEMKNIATDVAKYSSYAEMYLTSFQLRPFFGATLADGEKVYLRDIKIYTVNPANQSAENGEQYNVTFYSDDSKTTVESTESYTSNIAAYAEKITMPEPKSAKDGFAFIGWKKVGGSKVYAVGDTYTFVDGSDIEFVGVWQADEVYVSESGSDSNYGTSSDPVASIERAIEILGADRGGKIYISDTAAYENVPEHSAEITFEGIGSDATLTCDSAINLKGDTVLKNLTVSATGGVFTFTHELTCENVKAAEVSLGGDMTVGGNGVQPQAELAVLDGGEYTSVYLGGVDDNYTYGTYTKGNTLYINDATADAVYIGHQTDKDQLFAGDVNVIVNNSTVGSVTDSGRAIGWLAGAVQVLANYGTSVTSSISTTSISFGKWFMNSDSKGGLDVTDTEGVFTVLDGKTAVATNASTGDVYYSVDSTLKVPAGTYSVTYRDTAVYGYSEDMQTLTVVTDFEADFNLIEYPELDGMLFLGWEYEDGTAPKTGDTLAAGSVLYAQYTDFDKNDGGDFYIESTEIRQADEAEEPALRFIVNRSANVDIPNANYGTVALPKIVVQYEALEIGKQYEYPYGSGNMHTVQNVPALNTYVDTDEYTKYTLCITDMPAEEYIRDITVRGYVSFTDLNGLERTEYTNKKSSNLYAVAKAAQRTDLTDAARSAHEEYGETPVGYREEQQTSHGETAHQTNYSGTLFMETTIDLGIDEPLEFISYGDQHFKYMDGLDYEDPEIMYTAKKRKDSVNPIRRHYQSAQTMMEYASMFDYTMSVGDTVDFFSYGSLDIAKDVLFDKDPDMLVALGYHDYVVYTMNGRSSKEFNQSAAKKVLSSMYPNDITYASYDVPNTPIKVVYMDDSRNGQYYYSDGIHDKLAADIADAKANGKYIFIMKHEGMCTNDEDATTQEGFITGDLNDENSIGYVNTINKYINYKTQQGNVWFNTISGQENYDQVKGTKAVLELIYHNADVIKGVFHGHVHANYVSEIKADYTDSEGNVVETTIPQYSSMLNGSFDYGMGIKINIK